MDMDNLLEKARKRRVRGNTDSATVILENYIRNNTSDPYGYIEYAKTKLSVGDYKEAKEYCERALTCGLKKEKYHETLAYIFLAQDEFATCDLEIQKCLKENPNNAIAHGIQGWILFKQGDNRGAIDGLSEAISMERTNRWISERLRYVFSSNEDFKLALKETFSFFWIEPSFRAPMDMLILVGKIWPKPFLIAIITIYALVLLINSLYIFPLALFIIYFSYFTIQYNKEVGNDPPKAISAISGFVLAIYLLRLVMRYTGM